MTFSITLIIIVITSLISYQAFNKSELFYRLLHNPYNVIHRKEYSRIISHGFIHGGWGHLIFNMYVLWMFGSLVEQIFVANYQFGKAYFVVLYFGGMVFATLPSIKKHKNNPNYNAVGASGAVSAVVFSAVLLNPLMKMGIILIPVMIPAFIFGPLYLVAEYILNKRGGSPIAHDAHLWGAFYGIIFTVLIDFNIIVRFLDRVVGYF